MNKRCIINVATGTFYCKQQERLVNSFLKSVDNVTIIHTDRVANWNTGWRTGIDLLVWNDLFPVGARPHEESQYGFKIHAMKQARDRGYTSVLWLDSPAFAVARNISPIFDVIEKQGYYAMSHIDPLINQVGDSYLKFYRMKRNLLEGYNLPSGSCYGFDLANPVGKGVGAEIFRVMEHDEFRGLFRSETGDTWNHRHDEACLAGVLKRMKLEVALYDPLFQSERDECLIRNGKPEND